MEGKKVILITDADTALSFQIVRAFFGFSEAYHILLGGRSIEKAEAATHNATAEFSTSKSSVSAIRIDIGDDASIEAAFNTVQTTYGRLDALVNNAGETFVLVPPFLLVDTGVGEGNHSHERKPLSQRQPIIKLISPTGAQLDPQYHAGQLTMREMWNASWKVNMAGTQVTTYTFAALLLKQAQSSPPRLLSITSGTSTLAGSENAALPINCPAPAGPWPKPVHHLTAVPAHRSANTGMNMMMRYVSCDQGAGYAVTRPFS
jgi:NAD(P)-dependent dehydrogenase (short-subunit alcohol dehydrogenase family)